MALADAGSAAALLMSPWARPDGAASSSPPALCAAQGLALQYFTQASWIWTACLAWHLRTLILHGRHRDVRVYHLLAWGVPALQLMGLLSTPGLFGESDRPWCWIASRADGAWRWDGAALQLWVGHFPVALILAWNACA